jgi:hypothetical protein
VAVLIAVAGYPALTASSETSPPSVAVVDLQAPPTEDGTCSADDFSPTPDAEEVACSRCPDGSPSCWTDKQCDSVCGGKGSGICERINSCYKCCLCAF